MYQWNTAKVNYVSGVEKLWSSDAENHIVALVLGQYKIFDKDIRALHRGKLNTEVINSFLQLKVNDSNKKVPKKHFIDFVLFFIIDAIQKN